MNGSYSSPLVALSLLVAIVASYTGLDLASRVHVLRPRSAKQFAWLLGGAIVIGTGIWSMHLIGMLAFHMPVAIGHDLRFTGLALLVAMTLSFVALRIVSGTSVNSVRVAAGGLSMGLAIAATHYTAMLALHNQPQFTYNPLVVCASVMIGIAASWTSLWLASSLLRDASQRHGLLTRAVAGLAMGLAITGTHYTAMRAATFTGQTIWRGAAIVDTTWLASIVAFATLVLLISTLLLSRMDKGYDSITVRMEASLKDAHQKLVLMASHDSLTNLPNRASLLERMHEMIARSAHTGHPFTVMFADLDGFKTINDSLGHAIGDSLLIEFARHLRNSVRRDDMVARMGGDEFVVLLSGLGHHHDITPVVRNILQRMQHDFVVADTPLRMTASIGLASYPTDGTAAEDLLKHADTAMYDAKQRGKNNFRFYEIEMSRTASHTLFIYRALAEAFGKDQISLHYQPKFNGATHELTGAEALIRWKHPEMGEIPPLQFIPIAERTGQIVKAGNWVIQEVCRHINLWDREKLPPVKIAINLSPEQVCFPRYIETVMGILSVAAVPPSRILFEITETSAMRSPEISAQVLRQFKVAGFDISIDDFGTGYSSLAYLQQFRVKQLKIDRFFIHELDNGEQGGVPIVAAIIAMAHSLDMVVVAEGVETESQLAALKMLHCDEIQGFYLGRPVEAGSFATFLRTQSPRPASPTLRPRIHTVTKVEPIRPSTLSAS